jgi:hypothetical protein
MPVTQLSLTDPVQIYTDFENGTKALRHKDGNCPEILRSCGLMHHILNDPRQQDCMNARPPNVYQ